MRNTCSACSQRAVTSVIHVSTVITALYQRRGNSTDKQSEPSSIALRYRCQDRAKEGPRRNNKVTDMLSKRPDGNTTGGASIHFTLSLDNTIPHSFSSSFRCRSSVRQACRAVDYSNTESWRPHPMRITAAQTVGHQVLVASR